MYPYPVKETEFNFLEIACSYFKFGLGQLKSCQKILLKLVLNCLLLLIINLRKTITIHLSI